MKEFVLFFVIVCYAYLLWSAISTQIATKGKSKRLKHHPLDESNLNRELNEVRKGIVWFNELPWYQYAWQFVRVCITCMLIIGALVLWG